MTKISIELPQQYVGRDLDGDWQITYHFENYLIVTSVIADSGEAAIRFAADNLVNDLPANQPEEITAKLCGVFGGYLG